MTTRQDYMEANSNAADEAGRVAVHHTYYSQFVTPAIIAMVVREFGIVLLSKSLPLDRHLNNIPLQRWDDLAGGLRCQLCASKLREAGDGPSLGNGVCILKTAARMAVEAARK